MSLYRAIGWRNKEAAFWRDSDIEFLHIMGIMQTCSAAKPGLLRRDAGLTSDISL